jgi:hypothetical protein
LKAAKDHPLAVEGHRIVFGRESWIVHDRLLGGIARCLIGPLDP